MVICHKQNSIVIYANSLLAANVASKLSALSYICMVAFVAVVKQVNNMKTGDILYANLGWSAGIPTWWKVVKATAKSVWIHRLKSYVTSDDGYGQNGYKMPMVDSLDDDCRTIMRRVAVTRYGEEVRINNYSTASIWDGNAHAFYTD